MLFAVVSVISKQLVGRQIWRCFIGRKISNMYNFDKKNNNKEQMHARIAIDGWISLIFSVTFQNCRYNLWMCFTIHGQSQLMATNATGLYWKIIKQIYGNNECVAPKRCALSNSAYGDFYLFASRHLYIWKKTKRKTHTQKYYQRQSLCTSISHWD